MAATPPAQIVGSPETPRTPLHGAAYDHEDSPRRSSARLRQKRPFTNVASEPSIEQISVLNTPKKKTRTSSFELCSPDQTPPQRQTSHRVHVMSPMSPDSDSFAPKPINSRSSMQQPFLSATTTMNEGMLPTPVKTPNKKQKTVHKSNTAARALFQDQVAADEMAPALKRGRKNKRFNGFSLESFRAEDGVAPSGIQIFTDSRDQVPEANRDDDNPFVDNDKPEMKSKKVAGTTKRRRVSTSKKLDPQVEQALRDDDGMVYVFRGKKVYRRFDDTGEEEEEIDAADLGLLEGVTGSERLIRPLKTLTRKSIKPTRLFQTEEQKRARELEKEEEATTDIDDKPNAQASTNPFASDDQSQPEKSKAKGKGKAVKNNAEDPETNGKVRGKKGSPFDSWARIKPGSASSTSATKTSRGRKRNASEALDEPLATQS